MNPRSPGEIIYATLRGDSATVSENWGPTPSISRVCPGSLPRAAARCAHPDRQNDDETRD
jgi:hypothetical protein